MWSKFTEYAEGIVEIVAQADAAASSDPQQQQQQQSPPLSSSSSSSERQITGEEIWSRFTSIVAPPAAPPSSQKTSSRVSGEAAPRSAPPSLDQLRQAQAQDGGAAKKPDASRKTDRQHHQEEQQHSNTKTIDEDEQEQYICELERALLQRKKQNEVLEKKVFELEYRHAQENSRVMLQLQDKERLIADQKLRIETLRLQQEDKAEEASQERETAKKNADVSVAAGDDPALVQKVEQLEQRLRGLAARCTSLQEKYDRVRQSQALQFDLSIPGRSNAGAEHPGMKHVNYDDLKHVSVVLSTIVSSDPAPSVHAEDSIVAHIVELTKQVQEYAADKTERVSAWESTVGSFLARHGEPLAGGARDVAPSAIHSNLDAISHKLSESVSNAAEVDRLRVKIHTLEDNEEEQLKKILHLQAQANSMHANLQKTDKSLQQTASKEADLMEIIQEKEASIKRLEGNVTQVKASMEHLASELKEAQSYTDELEGYCRQQKQKIASQRSRIAELDHVKTAYEELREQERDVRARASEYEQGYVDLLAEIEKLKAQNEEESKMLIASTEAHAVSTENQTIYDLESRLSASEADKQIALQDAERLQQSVDALEGVLHQFQVDQKHQRERLLELEVALEKAQQQVQEQQQQSSAKKHGDDDGSDLQRVIDVLAKKSQECEQLREVRLILFLLSIDDGDRMVCAFCVQALENTAARYTADNEVLDKRLAAQLVGFSDEQKRRVGLGFPIEGNGGGGLFSSILGLVVPQDGSNPSSSAQGEQRAAARGSRPGANLDGKSFADIWTEFLIDEAKK